LYSGSERAKTTKAKSAQAGGDFKLNTGARKAARSKLQSGMTRAGDDPNVHIANGALNRVLRFNAEENRRREHLPESGMLFHYTTAEGLKGIVENSELWASSAYFLNDSAEVNYGCGVFEEVLSEWIATSGRDEDSLALGLAHDLRGQFTDKRLNNFAPPIYLTSFCEDGNLLSQWRTYGASGGYALGFNFFPHGAGGLFKPEPKSYTVRLAKVEYERSEQIKRCKAILDTLLPIYDEPEIANAIREVADHGMVNYQRQQGIVGEILMEEALAFKDRAFSVEKEWRFVVRRRELLKQGDDNGEDAQKLVRFRPTQRYAVPYLRLIPAGSNTRLPLRVVRSGPTLDRLSVVLSVHPLLYRYDYGDVRVEESGISVRS
jgi:hypothetical protein